MYLDRHADYLTSQQVFQPRQHPSFLLLYSAGGSSFNASRALAWSLPVLTQFSGADLGLGKMEFELQTTMEGSVKYLPAEHWLKLNRGQVSVPVVCPVASSKSLVASSKSLSEDAGWILPRQIPRFNDD